MRIGFIGHRPDLAVEVASLAMRSGASVHTMAADLAGPDSDRTDPQSAVDLLLADVDALADCATGQLPVRAGARAVVCRPGEAERAARAAEQVHCRHVVELPTAAKWLESQLVAPARSSLLGVLAAVGGAGATTAAIACAMGAGGECLLVDADPLSAGLDLPLGFDDTSGVRWAQIPEASAPLDAESLRSALPRVADCPVVTGPVTQTSGWADGPSASQCAGVLDVGRSHFERTVVDVGRARDPAQLLGPADALALVIPSTLAGIVAARSMLSHLPTARVVLLVRPSPWLASTEVAAQVGVAEMVTVPHLRRVGELSDCGDLLSGRTGRAMRAFGRRVWECWP